MQQRRPSEITVDKITGRELEKVIPELYELDEIIENNISHNSQRVFDHTIAVLIKLERLFKRVNERIKNYLASTVDLYSRRELLFFAAVLHDIGKKETAKKKGDIIEFPGHEETGAQKLKKIMPRFILSENEKEMIIQIVKNHGFFRNLSHSSEDELHRRSKELQHRYPGIFLEVTLLALADILGSHLHKNNPEEFSRRANFLGKIIETY